MIRRLTADDSKLYQPLRLKALQTDGKYYQSSYEIESQQSELFFARVLQDAMVPPIYGYYGYFVGDQLAGYIHLDYDWSPKKQHTAKLTNLYVDPDFRGQKIGQQLFDYVTKLGKEHGLEKLYLQCSASNESALKLYDRQGFKIYAKNEKALKWQGKYDDIVYLEKEL